MLHTLEHGEKGRDQCEKELEKKTDKVVLTIRMAALSMRQLLISDFFLALIFLNSSYHIRIMRHTCLYGHKEFFVFYNQLGLFDFVYLNV